MCLRRNKPFIHPPGSIRASEDQWASCTQQKNYYGPRVPMTLCLFVVWKRSSAHIAVHGPWCVCVCVCVDDATVPLPPETEILGEWTSGAKAPFGLFVWCDYNTSKILKNWCGQNSNRICVNVPKKNTIF